MTNVTGQIYRSRKIGATWQNESKSILKIVEIDFVWTTVFVLFMFTILFILYILYLNLYLN